MTKTLRDDDLECLHIRAAKEFGAGRYRLWIEYDHEVGHAVYCACPTPPRKRRT